MPIIKQHAWYTVAACRLNPDTLYVFGDNLARVGRGGQATIRREPNAVGIPTKRDPDTLDSSYLTDRDWDDPAFRDHLDRAFTRLRDHLAAGGVVVLPADGIGTGRARLPATAPALLARLNAMLAELETTYGTTEV